MLSSDFSCQWEVLLKISFMSGCSFLISFPTSVMIPKNNCPSNIDVHNGYQSFGTKYADFQDISIIQHHSLATVGFFQYKFYLKGQNGKDTSLKKDLWCQSPS